MPDLFTDSLYNPASRCRFLTTREIVWLKIRIKSFDLQISGGERWGSVEGEQLRDVVPLGTACDVLRAPTFLELAPRRYCVYEWVCERDTHAARAWHRCASTRRARRLATLRRRGRCRWNCRLVAQDRSFDFIREPSNINSDWWLPPCCTAVRFSSADAILVPVLSGVPLFHLSALASQFTKTVLVSDEWNDDSSRISF